MTYKDIEAGRAYQRTYQLNKYYERKAMAIDYLGGVCVDCGTSDSSILEFDHRDQSTKSFTVTAKLGGASWERLKEELDKCDLRCIACHGHVTAYQRLQKVDVLGAVICKLE